MTVGSNLGGGPSADRLQQAIVHPVLPFEGHEFDGLTAGQRRDPLFRPSQPKIEPIPSALFKHV